MINCRLYTPLYTEAGNVIIKIHFIIYIKVSELAILRNFSYFSYPSFYSFYALALFLYFVFFWYSDHFCLTAPPKSHKIQKKLIFKI